MKVIELFSFPKGSSPRAFSVPPIACDGYGYGMYYTEQPRPTLVLTNDTHLLLLDPVQRKIRRILQSPLGKSVGLKCVTTTIGFKGQLLCYLACSDGTFAAVEESGYQYERFGYPEVALVSENIQQMHIVNLNSQKSLVLWAERGSVWLIDLEEVYKTCRPARQVASSARGIAKDPRGRIWIASAERKPAEGPFFYVVPPTPSQLGLPPERSFVTLVGVDRWGRFYWKVRWSIKKRSQFLVYTDLLCTLATGDVRYRVRLLGEGAILPEFRDGGQIDEIFVKPRGEVYVFGFDYEPGTKVKVYLMTP